MVLPDYSKSLKFEFVSGKSHYYRQQSSTKKCLFYSKLIIKLVLIKVCFDFYPCSDGVFVRAEVFTKSAHYFWKFRVWPKIQEISFDTFETTGFESETAFSRHSGNSSKTAIIWRPFSTRKTHFSIHSTVKPAYFWKPSHSVWNLRRFSTYIHCRYFLNFQTESIKRLKSCFWYCNGNLGSDCLKHDLTIFNRIQEFLGMRDWSYYKF